MAALLFEGSFTSSSGAFYLFLLVAAISIDAHLKPTYFESLEAIPRSLSSVPSCNGTSSLNSSEEAPIRCCLLPSDLDDWPCLNKAKAGDSESFRLS